jgi:two-component system response regulator RegA
MSATPAAAVAVAPNESSPHDVWSSTWQPAPRSHERTRRAVVLDEATSSQRQLCAELASCGWTVVTVHEIAGLRAAIGSSEPDLVVAEYRLAGKSIVDLLECIPRALWSRLVVVTAYGSVASAVRAVKLGVGGYLVKPAGGAHVLRAVGHDAAGSDDVPVSSYLSLDRAIWEVLNEAVEQAGTVSGAARRLGLHARSLRRMLAKYPPAR